MSNPIGSSGPVFEYPRRDVYAESVSGAYVVWGYLQEQKHRNKIARLIGGQQVKKVSRIEDNSARFEDSTDRPSGDSRPGRLLDTVVWGGEIKKGDYSLQKPKDNRYSA